MKFSRVDSYAYGCYMRHTCVGILLYTDDILLLLPSPPPSPAVSSLQLLLGV